MSPGSGPRGLCWNVTPVASELLAVTLSRLLCGVGLMRPSPGTRAAASNLFTGRLPTGQGGRPPPWPLGPSRRWSPFTAVSSSPIWDSLGGSRWHIQHSARDTGPAEWALPVSQSRWKVLWESLTWGFQGGSCALPVETGPFLFLCFTTKAGFPGLFNHRIKIY